MLVFFESVSANISSYHRLIIDKEAIPLIQLKQEDRFIWLFACSLNLVLIKQYTEYRSLGERERS